MSISKRLKIASTVALFMGCAFATTAQAQTVKAPPLPPGSHMVRINPGMSKDEDKRSERAHHHKFHNKKDVTRDDTVHGDPSNDHNHDKPVPAAALAKK